MAKRSREDSDPVSPASEGTRHSPDTRPYVDQPRPTEGSSTKIIQLDSESGVVPHTVEMICSLPPHGQTIAFASYEEYEVHYNKVHVNRCLECRKNLPTEHFLNLHIEENHDALVSVKRERGEKTYACFVEDCDRKCSSPEKRRMHLIDKHFFPKDYDFSIVNDGMDHRTSMLKSGRHRRQSSAKYRVTGVHDRATQISTQGLDSSNASKHNNGDNEARNTEQNMPFENSGSGADADMESLTGAMCSLNFVPSSVRFGRGRGKGRGGFSKS